MRVSLCLFSLSVFLPTHLVASEMIYKLDGIVDKVDLTNRILYVRFEHPATGEVSEKIFHVSEGTGFKNVKGLEKLKKGDMVGNYEVVEIEKGKVMLRKGGQSFYITLPEE